MLHSVQHDTRCGLAEARLAGAYGYQQEPVLPGGLPGLISHCIHTHSLVQTVASRLFAGAGHVRLEGFELLKAFHGNHTHEMAIDVPVFANTQDMPTLAAQVDALLDRQPLWGYLIDGHGLYAWGRTMAEARRHLEAFEFLFAAELELRKLGCRG